MLHDIDIFAIFRLRAAYMIMFEMFISCHTISPRYHTDILLHTPLFYTMPCRHTALSPAAMLPLLLQSEDKANYVVVIIRRFLTAASLSLFRCCCRVICFAAFFDMLRAMPLDTPLMLLMPPRYYAMLYAYAITLMLLLCLLFC